MLLIKMCLENDLFPPPIYSDKLKKSEYYQCLKESNSIALSKFLKSSLLQELQIFNDGNSRTARLFTFALEIQNKTQVPLIFNETDKTFYKSILTSFEHDDYSISSSLILLEHEDRLSSILYNQEQLIEDMKEEKNGNTNNT